MVICRSICSISSLIHMILLFPFFYPLHSFVHHFCMSANSNKDIVLKLFVVISDEMKSRWSPLMKQQSWILKIAWSHCHSNQVWQRKWYSDGKKCAAHSKFLFWLLNLLLFISNFCCFHRFCCWSSLLVALPSKTMADIIKKQTISWKTRDKNDICGPPYRGLTSSYDHITYT